MPEDPTRHALLAVRGLATRADDRTLQTDLDLDVAAGEVVAVRGPSGCGKTTFLRTLAGLQDPAAGEVRLRGESPERLGWPAWRRQVALVAQVPAIFPGTVAANLARPFTYRQNGGRQPATDRARRLLDRVLLRDVALDAAADRLSVGQQQRLAVVRALLLEPAVLLLDEPTSALDGEAARRLLALIRAEIAARDGGALVVTHGVFGGNRWYDRVLELRATGGPTAPGRARGAS